jgi:hypothetical protein
LTRLDDLRSWGYYAREHLGPVEVAVNVALYALPLPDVGLRLEECHLSAWVAFGTRAMSDDVVSASVTVPLPGVIADALDRVLP